LTDNTDSNSTPQGRRTWLIFAFVAIFALTVLLFAFAGGGGSKAEVGKPAPAFKVVTAEGLEIDSLKLHGSLIVVNFFASWCQPCQTEAEDLQAIWEQYEDQGVLFVAIAHKDIESKIAEFVDQHEITFPIVNSSRNVGNDYGITGIPETYVIGRDGLVVYKKLGAIDPNELRQVLDAALQ